MSTLLTAAEAAALLSVPKSWVLAEARADRLPHVKIGRYVRFRHDSLIAWVEARERGPVRKKQRSTAASAPSASIPVQGLTGGNGSGDTA
jgi:excisionase family DNA binding protein